MKNFVLVFLLIGALLLVACEKTEDIEIKEAKQTPSYKDNNEPNMKTIDYLEIIKEKSFTKATGEQIMIIDGDKTLYIYPEFAELIGNPPVVYGDNIYNFVSGMQQVNGLWITTYFCEGLGTTCGFVYNQLPNGSLERIGVYFVAPQ